MLEGKVASDRIWGLEEPDWQFALMYEREFPQQLWRCQPLVLRRSRTHRKYVLVEDAGALSALVVHEDQSIGRSRLGIVVRSAGHAVAVRSGFLIYVSMAMHPAAVLLEMAGPLLFALGLGRGAGVVHRKFLES